MSAKYKEFHISNFDELFNVATKENIKELSTDLIQWFIYTHKIIEQAKEMYPKETKGKLNSEIFQASFTWIDDKKSGIIGVDIENKNTGKITKIDKNDI